MTNFSYCKAQQVSITVVMLSEKNTIQALCFKNSFIEMNS